MPCPAGPAAPLPGSLGLLRPRLPPLRFLYLVWRGALTFAAPLGYDSFITNTKRVAQAHGATVKLLGGQRCNRGLWKQKAGGQ